MRGWRSILGLTTLTLLLGWRLALLAPCLTLLVLDYFGVTNLADFGWQALVGIALPVASSWLLFLASWAWLPRHLFVYIFVAAFLGGALAISVKVAASALLMGISDSYPWHTITADYLSIWPLLLFPEALLNGMAMTVLAISPPPLGQHLLRLHLSGQITPFPQSARIKKGEAIASPFAIPNCGKSRLSAASGSDAVPG